MTDVFLQLLNGLPVLLAIILVKIPAAILMWRLMLNYLDKRMNINFKEQYESWSDTARADYHGKRALAAAIICAAIFL